MDAIRDRIGACLSIRRAGLRLALGAGLAALGTLLAAAAPAQTPEPAAGEGTAVVLRIDGAIGPATAGYVIDGLEAAAERGAAIVVLSMDTPGGLSASMREMIDAILDSPVPVAGFVAPSGARAASAGTYILYASHVAAMAPGTTLGAATPVQLGGGSSPLPGIGGAPEKPSDAPEGGKDAPAEDAGEGERGNAPGDAKTAKAVNDAAAYIRALAKLRGRNAEWAERAVREAATLTDDEALERGVIDLRAADVPTLLAAADGRTAKLGEAERTLATRNLALERMEPDWRTRLLSVITDPNVAFIFMMIGVYGLIFELANPGAVVPGVIGAISLIIGLYALSVLPVNYAGLGLLLLGIAFMTAEAFVPSFGVLGLGGLAAFALGATLLFDIESPAFALSPWVIGSVTAATGAVLVLLIGYVVRSHRRPVATGPVHLQTAPATVESWSGRAGTVRVRGELWNAVSDAPLSPGDRVRITEVEGLTLHVTPDNARQPT